MRVLFFLLWVIAFPALVSAQQTSLSTGDSAGVQAKNVAVNRYSVTALYDDAEFLLNHQAQEATVFFESASQTFAAAFIQIGNVYRAEISPSAWIEVNAQTGITLMHQDCLTRVFLPRSLLDLAGK